MIVIPWLHLWWTEKCQVHRQPLQVFDSICTPPQRAWKLFTFRPQVVTYVGMFWKIRSTTLILYFYVIKLPRRAGACGSCPRQNAWHCQQLPSPCLLAISSVHDSADSAEMKLEKVLEKVCYILLLVSICQCIYCNSSVCMSVYCNSQMSSWNPKQLRSCTRGRKFRGVYG